MDYTSGKAEKKKNIISFHQPAAFYQRRAMLALADDRILDALVFYRKAREIDPDNFDYAAGMADIYTELEFFEESNAVIYEAMRKHPKRAKECTFLMGCNFMGLSYLTNADKCFRKYMEDFPNGEFTEEIQNFFKFINSNDGYSDDVLLSAKDVYEYAKITKARQLIASKKEDASIEIYRDILSNDPLNTIALNDLSLAYYAKGDIENAVKCAKEVVDIDEENITALSNLIIFFKAVGDELSVTKLTNQLLNADMVTPEDFQKASFILSWIGLHEEAYDCVMELLSFNPHDVIGLHSAAVSAFNLESYQEAIRYWEDIIKMIPENTIAAYYIDYANRAIEGKKTEKLDYIFDISEKEKKRRYRALDVFMKKPLDVRQGIWASDGKIKNEFIWALDYAPTAMRMKLIESAADYGDERTIAILHRQLLKPKIKTLLKKKIIEALVRLGESEPFFADVDGKVDRYYTHSEMEDTDLIMGELQEIFLLAIGYLNKLEQPKLTEAFIMLYSMISENNGLKQVNPKHKRYIAAAIIYMAAKKSGIKMTMNTLSKAFGVSQGLIRTYRKILEDRLMIST